MSTKEISYCALFAVLIAIASQIQIPLPLVPINGALLAVHLCAMVLPVKSAVFSVLVYLVLGAIGLPVYSGMTAGIGVLMGATGGYLFGYLGSVALSSWMIHRQHSVYLSLVLGLLLCYSVGTLWFMQVTKMSLAASLSYCVFPFIMGDAIKIIIAKMIGHRIKKVPKHF